MLVRAAKQAIQRQIESRPYRLEAMKADEDVMRDTMLAERQRQSDLEQRHAEYVRSLPWDIKLASAMQSVVGRPHFYLRRAISKTIQGYPDIRSFLVAITGGIISAAKYKRRQSVCASCEFHRSSGSDDYCGACNCPKWPLARLSFKNRLSKHLCPRGKHDNSNSFKTQEP